MDAGLVIGIVIAIACGFASFAITRWFARRGDRKAEAARAAAEAQQSRQVRRARERQNKR
jgi:type II secretory pathway pseudopilin PulG